MASQRNQVSLLAYLQHGPPALPLIDQGQSEDNTTDRNYSADDITPVGHWVAFNLGSVMQQYSQLLANTQIDDDPMPSSPPQEINSEPGLRYGFVKYLNTRVDVHSVAASRKWSRIINSATVPWWILGKGAWPRRSTTTFLAGLISTPVSPCPPDRVAYRFRQALSQVNWYMKRHRTQYGFILTDRELVAIRSLDDDGNLEPSDSVPWDTVGTEDQPRLTVLLALWYLGMLASDNQQWRLGCDRA